MFFCHVTIHTDKPEEEIKFYKDYCGLQVLRHAGPISFMGNNASGETLVEIIPDNDSPYSGRNLSIGFKCEDVFAYREKLIAEGLDPTPIISPNPSVNFFFVKDPAGVTVQFI